MRFTVPQFIDYEAKVIGPLTFKQFIVMAIAGLICFVALLKTPFYVYIPVILIVGGGSAGLSLVKFKAQSPSTILKNFLFFKASPNIYIWKRKIIPTKVARRKIEKKAKEESPLKIVRKSKLKDLSNKIETTKRQIK